MKISDNLFVLPVQMICWLLDYAVCHFQFLPDTNNSKNFSIRFPLDKFWCHINKDDATFSNF